jgi:hypothetical protein
MICKQCNNYFKTQQVINGKTRNLCKRKFCLECSPFGLHNTKSLKYKNNIVKTFSIVSTETQCIICKKIYFYKRKNGTTKDKCSSCLVNQRRFRIKINAVYYKGGKCVDCGYNSCITALSFHHRNPKEKDFNIGGNHSRKWVKIQAELDKCDLVCSNCHIERHAVWEYRCLNEIAKLLKPPISITPNVIKVTLHEKSISFR